MKYLELQMSNLFFVINRMNFLHPEYKGLLSQINKPEPETLNLKTPDKPNMGSIINRQVNKRDNIEW